MSITKTTIKNTGIVLEQQSAPSDEGSSTTQVYATGNNLFYKPEGQDAVQIGAAGGAVDIDAYSAFSGVPHATDDEFLISDGGTEKRATMTMVANGSFALVSGDATVAAGGALTIADNAVSLAKMAGLARGKIIYGDASGDPAALAAGDNGKLLVADANGDLSWTSVSGDVTLSAGAVTIAANAVEGSMLNNNIVSGLDDIDAAIAATDEMIISDAGTIKRTDVSRLGTFLAGDGIAVSSGVLAVGVDDSSIEINSDAIRVKATGVTNAMLAGSIANGKLSNSAVTVGSTSISLGATSTTIAGLTSLDCTAADQAIYATAGANTITLGGATSTVKCANDLTVTGDLIVNGTTTSINSVQLNVEDKKVRLGIPGGMVDAFYTISSNVVTVASANHGLSTGEYVYISDPAATAVITEGVYVITGDATNTFTFAFSASDQGSATAIQHGKDNVTNATGDGTGIFIAGRASTTATGIEWDTTNGWQILGGDLDIAASNNLSFAGTNILADSSGTLTLSNIDALDATTEATIEAAIDTLANLTSVQGNTLTLGGNFVTQNNNVTINAAGAARTLTLNESLTIGDGSDGTLTYSAASKTLTVEDNATVSQDMTSDATVQFAGIELSHASANTLTASGGILSIESVAIPTISSTDTLTNKTLTSPDINAGTVDAITSLTVGTDGSGADVRFFGAAANEELLWDASENTLSIINSSDATILTLGGDATSEYAIDVTAGSNNANKMRASAFVTHSKKSLKSNIAPISGRSALKDVMNMQGVTYKLRNMPAKPGLPDRKQEVGFIADDMVSVVPQVVTVDDTGAAQGIDYAKLTAVLTEAIKEQQKQIEALKSKVNKLA